MREVRVLVDYPVVIRNCTIDRNNPMPVRNDDMLEWPELKRELEKGTVEIAPSKKQ